MILRVAETVRMYKARLWQQLRRPQWFLRLHEEGLIASWLDGPDKDMREHALNAMANAVKEHPAIATLLRDARAHPTISTGCAGRSVSRTCTKTGHSSISCSTLSGRADTTQRSTNCGLPRRPSETQGFLGY